MGRGNVRTFGKYEGLYYVDNELITVSGEDESGVMELDQFLSQMRYEDAIENFRIDFTSKFKSFEVVDDYIDHRNHAILENELFYITLEDNESSVAFKLIQKEPSYYLNYNIENLQKRHFSKYLEHIKNCLFKQFDKLGIYAGPWTQGVITR